MTIASITQTFQLFNPNSQQKEEFNLSNRQIIYIQQNHIDIDPLLSAACTISITKEDSMFDCADQEYLEEHKSIILQSDMYEYYQSVTDKQGYTFHSGPMPDEEYITNNLSFPLTSWWYVSENYGFRISPVGNREFEFHNALDLATDEGNPLVAMTNGKVITVSYDEVRGNYLTIQSDALLSYPDCYGGHYEDNVSTGNKVCIIDEVLPEYDVQLRYSYLHMEKIDVEQGERVTHGEYVGTVGSTGQVTGPHVHLMIQISINGSPWAYVNPYFILNYIQY